MKNPAAVDLNSVVVQTEDLLSSDLDGDTVLMSLTQAAYYGLDSTAQRIWNMIPQPCRVADLCERLVSDYAVERTTCEQEVCAFLTEMKKEGLIRVVAEDDS
jgi:hypothetical protein